MQIPMEIIPQLGLQQSTALPGVGNRFKTGSENSFDGLSFDEVLEDARASAESVRNNSTNSTNARVSDDTGSEIIANECTEQAVETEQPTETERPEETTPEQELPEYDEQDYAEAAACANIAQEVIVILEGDMESVNYPQESVAEYAVAETAEVTVEIANAVQKYDAPKDAFTEVLNEAVDEGEVTARMPEIRTSEQSTTENSKYSELTEQGDLSPLENENEIVKAHSDKPYAEVANAVAEETVADEATTDTAAIPVSADLAPERFQADQQLQKVTADAPVPADNLFDAMVEKIELMNADGQKQMTIQLKPALLGQLTLQLALGANGLLLKINAGDQSVSSMIGAQINALIESLEEKGIAIAEVEVTYTGVDNGTLTDPRGSDGQTRGSNRSSSGYYINNDADSVEQYAAMALGEYFLENEISTVEYSA